MKEDLKSVTEEVQEHDMPCEANLLSTNFVFKIKNSENGERMIEERLGVQGIHDEEKDEVRKD